MKTSSKLLLGLLLAVIIGIIVVNLVYKHKLDSKAKIKIELQSTSTKVNSVDSDSIAMDNALDNQ